MATANRKVPGNDVFLFLDLGGGTSYGTVVCLTNVSFEIINNIIDAKSKCGADTLPGTQSFPVDFAGQVIYNAGGANVGTYEIMVAAKNQSTVGWKISTESPTAYDVIITGTGFIGNFKTEYGDEAPSTFSATLGVYGTPTITENPS